MTKIPNNLQGVLWSRDIKKSVVVDVFLKYPSKGYDSQNLDFVKNTLLRLDNIEIDVRRYLKHLPRVLEPFPVMSWKKI